MCGGAAARLGHGAKAPLRGPPFRGTAPHAEGGGRAAAGAGRLSSSGGGCAHQVWWLVGGRRLLRAHVLLCLGQLCARIFLQELANFCVVLCSLGAQGSTVTLQRRCALLDSVDLDLGLLLDPAGCEEVDACGDCHEHCWPCIDGLCSSWCRVGRISLRCPSLGRISLPCPSPDPGSFRGLPPRLREPDG